VRIVPTTALAGVSGREESSRAKAPSEKLLPDSKRHIYAATYGEPPDPPATAALLAALAEAAMLAVTSSGQNLPPSAAARSSQTPLKDASR
jgi:hypothetical protein